MRQTRELSDKTRTAHILHFPLFQRQRDKVNLDYQDEREINEGILIYFRVFYVLNFTAQWKYLPPLFAQFWEKKVDMRHLSFGMILLDTPVI